MIFFSGDAPAFRDGVRAYEQPQDGAARVCERRLFAVQVCERPLYAVRDDVPQQDGGAQGGERPPDGAVRDDDLQ